MKSVWIGVGALFISACEAGVVTSDDRTGENGPNEPSCTESIERESCVDDPGNGDPGNGDPGNGDPGNGDPGNGNPGDAAAALERGADFFGVPERFNRYYTDPDYAPSKSLYVSRNGNGSGASAADPASVDHGFASVRAGEEIVFLRDSQPYEGCWELDGEQSGTYEQPIVIRGERNPDGSRGVHIKCCESGRQTCINLEGADYVAVEGFVLEGGKYGVRAVGYGYEPSNNQVGVAMLNNEGFNQCADPFFSGQSSWLVAEGNLAHGAGSCDGHGIYLSNGGDYMIARNNELYGNQNSDLQINADPISTCSDEGIAYSDPACDGSVLDGLGQGVSEYILVESNFLHHGDAQGPNFTSVRNSVFRNNIIGPYAQHGTSFWQETDNPDLGSSGNKVHHNLFIGNNSRHVLQFVNQSGGNDVRNNVVMAVGGDPVLIDTDVGDNNFSGNFYVGTRFEGHSVQQDEHQLPTFEASWFQSYNATLSARPAGFSPSASSPFAGIGEHLSATPYDMAGEVRDSPTCLGPIEC